MDRWIRLKVLFRVCVLSFLLLGCTKKEAEVKKEKVNKVISVAAAANLKDVLDELKERYVKENPDKNVEITFASSGLLVQQIINGAPFDLFLSADSSFPEKLRKEGKAYQAPEIYAYGKIALWSSKLPLSEGLKTVLHPSVKKIAVANPELAPYGKNTVEALKKTGWYTEIEHKIVWAENISQAAQFASTGNADIAFIALSNAMSREMKIKGQWYELSKKESSPIPQSGVVLKGKNHVAAKHFFNYIKSSRSVKIWRKYGYQPENTL